MSNLGPDLRTDWQHIVIFVLDFLEFERKIWLTSQGNYDKTKAQNTYILYLKRKFKAVILIQDNWCYFSFKDEDKKKEEYVEEEITDTLGGLRKCWQRISEKIR